MGAMVKKRSRDEQRGGPEAPATVAAAAAAPPARPSPRKTPVQAEKGKPGTKPAGQVSAGLFGGVRTGKEGRHNGRLDSGE